MMRESWLQSSRRRGALHRFAAALILTALLAALLVSLRVPLLGLLASITRPFFFGAGALREGLETIPDRLLTKDELIARLEELREQEQESALLSLRARLLEEENVQLKAALGRRSYQSAVLAAVLARPATTPYDTLLIDIESAVEVGDRVVAEGEIVIGTVEAVSGDVARVLLFSSPGVETEVLIGPERIPVLARGQGGGSFVAEFPSDARVEEGYLVVMPGINPYLFSVVESVKASPENPLSTVRFKNPVNLQALTWVEVVTDKAEPPALLKIPPPAAATSTAATSSPASSL